MLYKMTHNNLFNPQFFFKELKQPFSFECLCLNSFIVILISSITNFVSAQLYEAKYIAKYNPNSENQILYNEEYCTLIIDNNLKVSYFFSDNFYKKDSILNLVKKGYLSSSEVIKNPQFRFATNFNSLVTKDFNNSVMITKEKIVSQKYQYNQQLEMPWELMNELSIINNYKCNKAVLFYAGRKYTAWYASDLPFSDGPFKFNGLPGLILRISDEENQYSFNLINLTKIKNKKFQGLYDEDRIKKVSFEQYKKIKIDYSENPALAFIDSGLNMSNEQETKIRNAAKKKKINNIEKAF
jgi:GLPGLI family protein